MMTKKKQEDKKTSKKNDCSQTTGQGVNKRRRDETVQLATEAYKLGLKMITTVKLTRQC